MGTDDKFRTYSSLRRPGHDGLAELGQRLQRDLDGGLQPVSDLAARHGITEHVDLTRVGVLVEEGGDVGAARRYRVVSPLAKGGMGAIFKAVEVTALRQVAMKVLLAGDSAKPLQVKRFLHEAQITAQLEHPNIIPVHEVGADAGGNLYYAMKYVRGVTLDEIIRGLRVGDTRQIRAYPLSRLLTVFQKACDAVAFAHAYGVVHRDLKPANIMVGDYGEVLVLDWGVAKLIGGTTRQRGGAESGERPIGEPAEAESEQVVQEVPEEEAYDVPNLAATLELPVTASSQDPLVTLAGEVVGTPNYMAPEQAQGKRDLGAQADVYSLGAILYTLLTTQPPIVATSLPELMLKKSTGEMPSPLVYHRSASRLHRLGLAPVSLAHCPHGRIPQSLAAVALKALALAPADRYADVPALQRDLEAYQAGFATAAEDAGLGRQVRLLVSRHRREAAILASALMLLTGLASAFVVWQARARATAEATLRELQAEQRERMRVSRQAAGDYLAQGWTAYRQRHWGEAAALCELARQLDAERPDAMLLAMLLQLGRGQPAMAVELARRASAPGDTELRVIWERCTKLLPALAPFLAQVTPDRGELPDGQLLSYADFLLKHGLEMPYDQVMELARSRAREGLSNGEGAILTAVAAAKKLLERRNGADGKLRFLSTFSNGVISLDLSRNDRLVGLEALTGLPIAELDLSYSGIVDLAGLEGLPLRRLDLKYTGVRQLRPLARCRELEWLDLTKTEVTDLEPLAGLPLRQVWATATGVSDLTPLAGAPLERLELAFCRQLRDLAPLGGSRLSVLNVEGTAVRSLRGLEGVPLRELSVAGTAIGELGPLREARLERLVATRSQLADLAPLAGMPLSELELGHTIVSSLAPLRGLPLTRLVLTGCDRLADLGPLSGCSQLRELLLPATCRELAPIRNLPDLERVGYGAQSEAAAAFWQRVEQR